MKLDYLHSRILLLTFTFSATIFHPQADAKRNSNADFHSALHRLVREKTHSHLQDFEIVLPEIIYASSRRKRDLPESDYENRPTRLSISSHNHDFDIEIVPTKSQLLSDDFFVHRIWHDEEHVAQTTKESVRMKQLSCHHVGRIVSHSDGTAAVSTCGGLTGLLRTGEDDFLIEPVPTDLSHHFNESWHPHILYNMRHLRQRGHDVSICGKAKQSPIPISARNISAIKEFSNGQLILLNEPPENSDPIQHTTRWRSKRSEPKRRREREKKVVDTLVVLDDKLLARHSHALLDVTQYVLTVMNMAAALYKDPTLDVEINILVSGIIILEDNQGLHLDHRADVSLANFCVWQSKLNITESRKPDHAVLITGTDICIDKNEPCDTLGLAQIGGMCSPTGSCTINEDTGLGVAFTIAHEIGHSFGLQHDGQGNTCGTRDGFIMSSTLNTDTGVFSWSSCSRRAMNNFLQSRKSQCLEDVPSPNNISFPDELPGQIFNASRQCQLQYGPQSDFCFEKYIYDSAAICKILFCYLERDGVCRTKHMPAAEGTSCGMNKWCRRGVCVPLHSSGPNPVNGRWSKYGPWSECSRTCGKGVSYKERFCTKPKPRFGGRYCEGDERVYRICNSQKCPPNTPTYRAQQCAKYNSQAYRRQYFSWIPFTRYWKYDYNKCELFCEAKGYDFFDRLASQVLDGTPCDEDTNDICIEGHCEHVGCDLRLNSHAREDACGVCNGDNSTCTFTNGSFLRPVYTSGYFYVTKIPKGARSVRIWQERCCTHTYIAARSPVNSSHYYLNGDWRVNLYGKVRFAETTWVYERKSLKGEALHTEGPLKEEITVEVLIVRSNPGIRFTYAMPKISKSGSATYAKHYTWVETPGPCSRTCGKGVRRVMVKCIENKKLVVQAKFCRHSKKPSSRMVTCSLRPCPAKWIFGNWSVCSRSCGGGIQVRRISCVLRSSNVTSIVTPKQCTSPKPKNHQKCSKDECPAEWKATRWTKCSRSCGRGTRSRTVYCRSGIRKLPDERCNATTQPRRGEVCLSRYCRSRYHWSVSRWGQCSVSCGAGKQYRKMKCMLRDRRTRRPRLVHYRLCKNSAKPRVLLYKRCTQHSCVPASTQRPPTTTHQSASISVGRVIQKEEDGDSIVQKSPPQYRRAGTWVSGSWQTCTKTCGNGRQVRAVRCMLLGRPSVTCSYERKPPNIRPCNTVLCRGISSKSGPCEDRHSWCRNAFQRRSCTHPYFARECCRSCRGVTRHRLPRMLA